MKFRQLGPDPAWEYRDRRKIRRDGAKPRFGFGAVNNYALTSTIDMAELPVQSVMDTAGSVLWCWTSAPQIPAAMELIEAWQYRYSTIAITWEKVNADGSPWYGPGSWTGSNVEPLLAAGAGDMEEILEVEFVLSGVHPSRPRRERMNVPQVWRLPHIRHGGHIVHSAKPSIIRETIGTIFPGPCLEMFARHNPIACPLFEAYRKWLQWGMCTPLPDQRLCRCPSTYWYQTGLEWDGLWAEDALALYANFPEGYSISDTELAKRAWLNQRYRPLFLTDIS